MAPGSNPRGSDSGNAQKPEIRKRRARVLSRKECDMMRENDLPNSRRGEGLGRDQQPGNNTEFGKSGRVSKLPANHVSHLLMLCKPQHVAELAGRHTKQAFIVRVRKSFVTGLVRKLVGNATPPTRIFELSDSAIELPKLHPPRPTPLRRYVRMRLGSDAEEVRP